MTLSPGTKTRLLGAIETNSLVLLCGAGLSIPSPSDLPTAMRVAQRCYDKWIANEPSLDPALRNDINGLAALFHGRGQFQVFINLVPWGDLVGSPNAGHAAVADLLISKAARATLSANFDPLIETWAEAHKVSMLGALTGQEAQDAGNPLVKFHGCLRRDRSSTLWTSLQLSDLTVQTRVKSCTQWMNLTLPGKHLLVIGFWTDWGYLNDVLSQAFAIQNAESVTVIDLDASVNLQKKAPTLWTKLNALSNVFEHIRASGAEILEELQTEFGRVWMRKLFNSGIPLAEEAGIAASEIAPLSVTDGLASNALYDFRRDCEGAPYNRAAVHAAPPPSSAQVAFLYIRLLRAGATWFNSWLSFNGKLIRIVNGAGQGLSTFKAGYNEPTTTVQPDTVICAGAIDFGVPGRIVPLGRGASVVRPAPGGGARWMTSEQAMAELKL